ncbi:hypothetical protein [Sphaerochaeta sp. PS]|uniref:hypothetical protein n=1 Tax=Sphaerochaeta sp. PS TaxID=3076336 RepID=UPI0028A4D345|nr:hypothetical protein [Sphaerochaeta sp. PS]MDT4761833.1 hypothetical protein [Sphaerochaeta sp. PS]
MGAYLMTVVELDFRVRGARQRKIRNTLATIHSIVGQGFREQPAGEYLLLIGEEKALVVRKRNGKWVGIQ